VLCSLDFVDGVGCCVWLDFCEDVGGRGPGVGRVLVVGFGGFWAGSCVGLWWMSCIGVSGGVVWRASGFRAGP
jgi:hypothetical protein